MTIRRRVVLVVDPALMSAETEAYNHFEDIAEDIRGYNGCSDLGLRFWLPKLGGNEAFDLIIRREAMKNCEVVGCVSLGSYAHVTEERLHPWMSEFEKLLFSFLAPRKLPFFGICFAHQYLAWRAGWEAVGVNSAGQSVVRRYVQGERKVVLTDPRFALLLLPNVPKWWNAGTHQSQVTQWAYGQLRAGGLSCQVFERPQGRMEWGTVGLLSEADGHFFADARHYQIVRPRGGCGSVQGEAAHRARFAQTKVWERDPLASNVISAGYGVESSGTRFEHDALVHPVLPWYTVQTHPERPLTESSRRLLRNFFLLCLSRKPVT